MRAKQLYRRILKLHTTKLPPPLRKFGNIYVKNEFNQHQNVSTPQVLEQFFSSWEEYCELLEKKQPKIGKNLPNEILNSLNDSQIQTLDKLFKESQQ